MGFSIDYGFGLMGALVIVVLAVPAVIVLYWLIQLNRQVREELHEQDEDTPVT